MQRRFAWSVGIAITMMVFALAVPIVAEQSFGRTGLVALVEAAPPKPKPGPTPKPPVCFRGVSKNDHFWDSHRKEWTHYVEFNVDINRMGGRDAFWVSGPLPVSIWGVEKGKTRAGFSWFDNKKSPFGASAYSLCKKQ